MKKHTMLAAIFAVLVLGGCAENTQESENITDIKAHGNEPFWTITTDVEAGELRYQTPMDLEGTVFAMEAESTAEGWRFAVVDEEQPMVLTIMEKECQDDMSGWVFQYTATLEKEDATEFGCANPEGVDPEEPEFVQ